jgi:hypothetical protein
MMGAEIVTLLAHAGQESGRKFSDRRCERNAALFQRFVNVGLVGVNERIWIERLDWQSSAQ